MIDLLLILRWITAAAAIGVVWYTGPRAWRALRRPQVGDLAYLLFAGLAISRLFLIGKGLAYPNPPLSLTEAGLTFTGYVIGILAELGVLAHVRWEREP